LKLFQWHTIPHPPKKKKFDYIHIRIELFQ
jgi:hypothetical protein